MDVAPNRLGAMLELCWREWGLTPTSHPNRKPAMLRRTALLAALLVPLAIAGTVLAQAPPKPATTAEAAVPAGMELATFAGGCFWCVESDFDKVAGVTATISGYMGGKTANPSYKSVSAGGTGHAEVVQLTFDPKQVTYAQLLEKFWRTVDPYDAGGQFCDRGDVYRTGIFTHSAEQKQQAEASKARLQASGPKQPIVTEITPAATFTRAEEYHQDYHTKNPLQYQWYRSGCRRDARLEALWGKAKTQ